MISLYRRRAPNARKESRGKLTDEGGVSLGHERPLPPCSSPTPAMTSAGALEGIAWFRYSVRAGPFLRRRSTLLEPKDLARLRRLQTSPVSACRAQGKAACSTRSCQR